MQNQKLSQNTRQMTELINNYELCVVKSPPTYENSKSEYEHSNKQ